MVQDAKVMFENEPATSDKLSAAHSYLPILSLFSFCNLPISGHTVLPHYQSKGTQKCYAICIIWNIIIVMRCSPLNSTWRLIRDELVIISFLI